MVRDCSLADTLTRPKNRLATVRGSSARVENLYLPHGGLMASEVKVGYFYGDDFSRLRVLLQDAFDLR
jgi:hypothetical protein